MLCLIKCQNSNVVSYENDNKLTKINSNDWKLICHNLPNFLIHSYSIQKFKCHIRISVRLF